MYSVGIDMGSSSLKYVVLDEKKIILKKGKANYHGDIENAVAVAIAEIERIADNNMVFFGVTGDMISRYEGLSDFYINGAMSSIKAAEKMNLQANSIMEIGAQKAKYITNFSGQGHFLISTNGSCAAGTGAFIEEQIQRIGVDFKQFDQMASIARTIPNIAGRCSVFSKTDIIHHQQAGVPTEDISLGLIYALVRNYKANVVQKHPINKPVLLTGGVMSSDNVIRAIKDVFQISDEELIRPEYYRYIGAIGAALSAEDEGEPVWTKYVKEHLQNAKVEKEAAMNYSIKGYGKADSLDKHVCSLVLAKAGYIGIDVGSISTNVVVIDDADNVIFNSYLRTAGKPLEAVNKGMAEIKRNLGDNFSIKAIGTTGSGRVFIGKELGALLVVDEITAQARGAYHVDRDVDTVFEIGGQDSKYISIKNGMVADFEMNKICAAGTGAFIEEQIKKLGINLQDFEDVALKSDSPLDLGDRCTVFIEGNVSRALAKGHKIEDVAAGLAFSIVSNYLNRVVGNRKIGDEILLQGGIAYNQAVVNAFRAILGKEVKVPKFFSVTGALGTALLTKEKFMAGEQGKMTKYQGSDILQRSEEAYLKGYSEELDPDKKTIGIPRALFMDKLFPIFNEIFKTLGFNVLLSKPTDDEIVKLSQENVLDETCLPVKLAVGHVAYLLNQGVDYVFLPNLYTMKHQSTDIRKNYACVYMQTISKLVDATLDFKSKGVKLIAPTLSISLGKKYMIGELVKMGGIIGKTKMQMAYAINRGIKRFLEFEKELGDLGTELLDGLDSEEKVFVIITRAYNVRDPKLNMQIPQKIIEMGYKVINLPHIAAYNYDVSGDYPNMYWPFGQHILSGVKIIKENPQLFPIYITNHGCGPDTVLSHFFKEEIGEKPYLHIEVDEHYSSIGVITRLEAFVNSVENYCREKKSPNLKIYNTSEKNTDEGVNELLIPYLYPYSSIITALFKQKGLKAREIEPTSRESLEIGEKLSVSKEYLSMAAVTGDILHKVKKRKQVGYTIFMPVNEGSEVSGQYARFIANKLKNNGCNFKMLSPFIEDLLYDPAYGYEMAWALTAGDVVMAANQKYRKNYLQAVIDMIASNRMNENELINLATAIAAKEKHEHYRKKFGVLGETPVIFNGFLNSFQLEKLEENYKLIYPSVSESLLLLSLDKYSEDKDNKNLRDLKKLQKLLAKLADILQNSPFERDVSNLSTAADKKLGRYAGGNARYRMGKVFSISERVDGIINVYSMYENSATILKMLGKKYEEEIKCPVLEIECDNSEHSQDQDMMDTFIKYLA